MKLEQLVTGIRERYEIELASFCTCRRLARHAGRARRGGRSWSGVRQALRSLGRGAISARSKRARGSLRSGCRYLTEQKADLELSIERPAPARDHAHQPHQPRPRFPARTFEAVDKVFQAVFPKMFDGGARPHLQLTDDEDVLEAGHRDHSRSRRARSCRT